MLLVSISCTSEYPAVIGLLREACDASADERVRTMPIVVRPYPGYEGLSLVSDARGVCILPPPVGGRRTLQDDALFYDAIFHALAVVALDSAAFFDAMAIGRPGIVYRDARFTDIQSAEHFSALMGHGALYEAGSQAVCADIISRLCADIDPLAPGRTAYLARFIRPRGIGKNAGEIVADELQKFL